MPVKRFDAIVIGGGIGGASIGYFLAKNDLNVCVVELAKIASGASGAAGAFLSPMMGKGSLVDFINEALAFSISFYEKIAPDLLVKNGALRFAKSGESIERFNDNIKLTKIEYERRGEAIFFPNAGAIDAVKLCERLFEKCVVFENAKADRLRYKNGEWHIGELSAQTLVVATGAYPSLLPDWWLKTRGVWGERLRVKPVRPIAYNYMSDIAISASFANQTAAIGATHKRAAIDWQIDPSAIDELLKKAIKMLPEIKNAEFLDILGGMRPASSDYIPIAGKFPNAHKILRDFPNLPNGERVAEDSFSYYPNLYYFGAHGARGFVTAPYVAKIVAKTIANGEKDIENPFKPSRFILRTFRRDIKASSCDTLKQFSPLEY
ncbi:MAG: FAD-dependent oxidoreductase [Helicobacteraceae bacterium]|nr:FAD-dependent oxidoreductase [Helicobacteraceae bacterium]